MSVFVSAFQSNHQIGENTSYTEDGLKDPKFWTTWPHIYLQVCEAKICNKESAKDKPLDIVWTDGHNWSHLFIWARHYIFGNAGYAG